MAEYESELVAITDVPSDDEAALSERISNLVRKYHVSAYLTDDTDVDGNPLVQFFGDEASVYMAVADLDPSQRYDDNG